MSMSFNKTFSVYEDGVVELVTIVSDIKEYIGDTYDQKEIIINLLDLLKEEIPSIDNENYPNTFSFKISAKEVEFKTDDGLRFGWIVILDNNNTIGYQFNINFDNLSRNKRKVISKLIDCEWKEYTDDQIEKVEEEIHFSHRPTNEKEFIQTQESYSGADEDIDVQSIHAQIQPDYSKANFLPTFIQDDTNIGEDMVNEQQQQDEEYDRQEYQPTKRPQVLGKSLLRSRQQTEIIQQYDENTEEQQEPQSIEEMAEAQDIMTADRQTVLQNGNIVEENYNNRGQIYQEDIDEDNTENGLIQLDAEYFSIRPGETPTSVILKFDGEEFPVNVLEQHAGIYRDVANKKLRIGRVVYDYQNFTVFGLPKNYTPDQAVFIAHEADPRHRQVIPDEAFVPQETIRKYEDIDIAAIQEEAIKREDYHTQMTGVRPRLKWNRGSVQHNNINDNSNQRPVLRQGRAFVMDTPSQDTNEQRFNNNNQSVRISNDGPSRWG